METNKRLPPLRSIWGACRKHKYGLAKQARVINLASGVVKHCDRNTSSKGRQVGRGDVPTMLTDGLNQRDRFNGPCCRRRREASCWLYKHAGGLMEALSLRAWVLYYGLAPKEHFNTKAAYNLFYTVCGYKLNHNGS